MDCLPARGMVLLSGLQITKQHAKRRVGAHRGEPKTFCCSGFPSEAAVFTASRLSSSVLRIIGPGSSFITSGMAHICFSLNTQCQSSQTMLQRLRNGQCKAINLAGLGSLLAFDEFFVHPFHQEENSLGPYQADCLTYFLEEKLEHDIDEESEDKSVKHGIQVFFQVCKKAGGGVYAENESTKRLPSSSLISKAESVEALFLESSNNKGGAKVRVVAGQYENVSTPVKENFVLLDVGMRPGAAAKIPVNPSHALIIYILEGVGIIKRDASVRPFYENEGHGIWFPPMSDNKLVGNYLHVTCHLWSSLRFLVLEIAVS